MQHGERMNYVMEVGPLRDGPWVLFSVDERLQVHLCVSVNRDVAIAEVARELAGRPTQCCSSLRVEGAALGWVPAPPPKKVLEIAAVSCVNVENFETFGARYLYPPYLDAWLRACSAYQGEKPWRRLRRGRRLLDVHFDGALQGRRVVAVFGDDQRSSIIIGDSLEAFEDESGPLELPGNCLAQLVWRDAPGTAELVAQVYDRAFVPTVFRLEKGQLTSIGEAELIQLTGITAAIASFSRQREYGRSVVEGLETIVLPFDVVPVGRKLAS